jgi:hypothetical protein
MIRAKHISQHFRLFLTAVTLLYALTINHQEIPAFATAPEKAPVTALDTAASPEQDKQVLKQKVSFEAVTSFVLLDLAQPLSFFRVPFEAPADLPFTLLKTDFGGTHFFSVLFGHAIQPNAP